MEMRALADGIEQTAGALLLSAVLLDVFLTVLYARASSGLGSRLVARTVWRVFVTIARSLPRAAGALLPFCGPAVLVTLVAFWAVTLMCGAALVIHPNLGSAVQAISGGTPRDFATAMYVGGSSMSIVGGSDFAPHTSGMRWFFMATSLVGMSVMSLTLTSLMQVYTALKHRNVLGLSLHAASAETGDAAELLAGYGPQGEFSGGYTNLSDVAVQMCLAKEAHHFYPVLFYFRFSEPFYSMSRITLLGLDTVSLIKSTLDDRQYAWFKESAAVEQLWRASMLVLATLDGIFVGELKGDSPHRPEAAAEDAWRRRYAAALDRLRQAGIQTIADENAGAERYVSLRARWDGQITRLAPAMGYTMEQIDPARLAPEPIHRPRDFHTRLRSAG